MTKNSDSPHTVRAISCRSFWRPTIFLLGMLCIYSLTFAAAAEEVSPDKPAEYMIYQYPGVALLIRIEASGIEFESRVLAQEGSLVMASRIPGSRLGPLYQIIEPVDKPRQLIVQVRPKQSSERSRISMELVQLSGSEHNSSAQLNAFRQLSLAAESTRANDTTTWSMKIYTFKKAAQAFAQLGWEELRLWCEYYAAHLIFFKLQDNLSAMEIARQVEAAARKAGIGIVELAALQLEGAALSQSAVTLSGLDAATVYDEIHRTYQLAATMADSLGLQQQRSWAIFNNGLVWEQQENLDRALEQYELALSIAVSEGNVEVSNLARNKAAYVYGMQGSISGAIEMLDQVGTREGDDSESVRQAKSLFEKGRLLSESAYFSAAIEALTESLDLYKAAGSRVGEGLSGMRLGQAYFGLGYMDQAEQVLLEAIRNTPTHPNQGALKDAFSALAVISRMKGDAGRMAEFREQQAAFVSSEHDRARFMFEESLDALRVQDSHSESALSLFSRSRQQAIKVGDKALQHRTMLYGCSLAPMGSSGRKQTCSRQAVRRSVDYLLTTGNPINTLESSWLLAIINRAEGRVSQSIQQMSQLVEDMRFFRSILPGVLGAWYWDNRGRIYADYMSLVLNRSSVNRRAFVDGQQTLVALTKIWAVERNGGFLTGPEIGPDGQDDGSQLRALLAKTQATPTRDAVTSDVAKIKDLLKLARNRFTVTAEVFDDSSLLQQLNLMSAGSALLSYYFADKNAYALVGKKDGVKLLALPDMQGTQAKLAEIRAVMGKQEGAVLGPSLELLGKQLLVPLESLLPELIYLMPSGPLSGFPFDLLRLNGRYFFELHQVINIETPSTMNHGMVLAESGELDLFFLAGKPDAGRDIFDFGQNPSVEIQAIANIFVGPSLHIVQGSALGLDEFQGGRFQSANIIHLALPGSIKLGFPEQSRMVLSGTVGKPGSKFLKPVDMRQNNFQASLAVLSGLKIEGTERLNLDQKLGFVSDLLASGVSLVITSLWENSDAERAGFFAEFYRNLKSNPDAVVALTMTRRAFLAETGSFSYKQWGGFQVYAK